MSAKEQQAQQTQQNVDISLFGEADPLVGSVINGRWEVESYLGEGSLSGAYRARDLQGDRQF